MEDFNCQCIYGSIASLLCLSASPLHSLHTYPSLQQVTRVLPTFGPISSSVHVYPVHWLRQGNFEETVCVYLNIVLKCSHSKEMS